MDLSTEEEYDFYDDLPDHVKESIRCGIKDIEEGRVRDHEEVMRDIKLKYGIAE